MPDSISICTLKGVKAQDSTRSAGCSHSSPSVSTNTTPVARLPALSSVMRSTSQLSRAVKPRLFTSTGRIVVCGLDFE